MLFNPYSKSNSYKLSKNLICLANETYRSDEEQKWDFGLPTLPIPMEKINEIDAFVGLVQEGSDLFYKNIIVPAEKRTTFLRSNPSTRETFQYINDREKLDICLKNEVILFKKTKCLAKAIPLIFNAVPTMIETNQNSDLNFLFNQ